MGGYNDVSTNRTEEQIDEAISKFVDKTKKYCPNAKISMMYPSVDYNNQEMEKN